MNRFLSDLSKLKAQRERVATIVDVKRAAGSVAVDDLGNAVFSDPGGNVVTLVYDGGVTKTLVWSGSVVTVTSALPDGGSVVRTLTSI